MYEYATKIAPMYNKKPPTDSGDYSTISTFLEVFNDIKLSGYPLVSIKIENLVQLVWAMYAEKLRKPIGKELVKKLSVASKLGQSSTVLGRKLDKSGEYNRKGVASMIMASTYDLLDKIAKNLPAGAIPIMTFRFGIVIDGISRKTAEKIVNETFPELPMVLTITEVKK
jgi:hypothetical protein